MNQEQKVKDQIRRLGQKISRKNKKRQEGKIKR